MKPIQRRKTIILHKNIPLDNYYIRKHVLLRWVTQPIAVGVKKGIFCNYVTKTNKQFSTSATVHTTHVRTTQNYKRYYTKLQTMLRMLSYVRTDRTTYMHIEYTCYVSYALYNNFCHLSYLI